MSLSRYQHWLGSKRVQWFGVSLLVLVLLLWLLPPRYASNDDMNLLFLTNGGLSYPTSYLVYTNVLLGSIIKHCFMVIPTLNWFTVWTLLVFIIVFYGFTIQYLDHHSIYLLILFEISLYFVLIHSYNYTTMAIGITLLAGFGLYHKLKTNPLDWLWIITYCVCFIYAFWLRYDSFLLGALMLSPWYVPLLIDLVAKRSYKLIITGLTTLSLIGISYGIDQWIGSNDQYDRYHAYESILHTINDYEYIEDYSTKYADHSHFYVNQGISVNTFDLLRHYTYADPDFFTLQRLSAIADYIETTAFQPDQYDSKIGMYMASPLHLVWMGLLVLTSVILMIYPMDKNDKTMAFVSIGLTIVVILVLIYLNRIPDRVGSALPLLLILLLIKDTRTDAFHLSLHYLVYGLIILYGFTQYSPISKVVETTWISDINTLNKDQDHIYLYDGFSPLMRQTFDFNFIHLDVPSINNTYRLGGWLYQLPANENILTVNGITNPFVALLTDPTVLLASNDNGAQRILLYLQEHYDPTATLTLVESYDNFNIYAFTGSTIA